MILCAILCTFMYSHENSRCSIRSHDFKLHDDKWYLTLFHMLIAICPFFEMFMSLDIFYLGFLSIQSFWNPLCKDVSLLLAFLPCLWLTYVFSSWWLWGTEVFYFLCSQYFFSFITFFFCSVYSKVMKKLSFFSLKAL